MTNPFEIIEVRLNNIETLLLDLKHSSKNKEEQTSLQNDKLLNIQEAAEFLNLSVPTIYSKVSKGELPVMKRSKRLYFSNTELLDYLKKGRKKTNSEIELDAEDYLKKRSK